LPRALAELRLNHNRIRSLTITPMTDRERSDQEILAALGVRGHHAHLSGGDVAHVKRSVGLGFF